MLNKIKVLAVITAILTLAACSSNITDTDEQKLVEDKIQENTEKSAEPDKVVTIPEYKIIEDTVKRGIKRTVEVELASRTNEEALKALAEKIYGLSDEKVERTFIGFRIAGNDVNQAYWATTHYNPNLKVNILGRNASDYEKVKNAPLPEGEIIGTWLVSRGVDYKMSAYKKDGQTYIQNIHSDGSTSDEVYELTQSDKGIKLQDEGGKDFGEYFIINQKGDLEFWSDNGNYYTAPKA